MTSAEYLKLLDWTAREHAGRRGKTPNYVAPLFERLEISESTWLKLAQNFGRLFSVVAGHPHTVDSHERMLANTAIEPPARLATCWSLCNQLPSDLGPALSAAPPLRADAGRGSIQHCNCPSLLVI